MFGKERIGLLFGVLFFGTVESVTSARTFETTAPPQLCQRCRTPRTTVSKYSSIRAKFQPDSSDNGCSKSKPRTSVSCGQVFVDERVNLESNLLCSGEGGAAITISGPGAILVSCPRLHAHIRTVRHEGMIDDDNPLMEDCHHQRLVGMTNWERGIVVQDGARVINCHTIGFTEGIVLEQGELHDSTSTNAVAAGIVIAATATDACITLEGVESFGNEHGLSYTGSSSGTTVWIKDSTFSDNRQAGITAHDNENFCWTLDNVTVKGNKDCGLHVMDAQKGSLQISHSDFISNTHVGILVDESSNLQVTLDNVSVLASAKSNISFKGSDLLVALYGLVQSTAVVADMGDGSFSYTSRGGTSVLEVYGSLDVFGNQLGGIGLINIDLIVMETGSIAACQNSAGLWDITTESGSVLGDSADRIVCDSFNGGPCAGGTCAMARGEAQVCTIAT
eukprot:scaffold451_cov184-Amphora_coffeaeformis.AAC.14